MNETLITQKNVMFTRDNSNLSKFEHLKPEVFSQTFFNFVDTGMTATNRATFYNIKTEQNDVVAKMHRNLISIDRGLYSATLLLDGYTDYTKQIGVLNLLSNIGDINTSLLDKNIETKIIEHVLNTLPAHRVLNLFLELKTQKINNARTKRIILQFILNSKNLNYWAVTYRRKIQLALKHALGQRTVSIIKSILDKKSWNEKEKSIIDSNIDTYVISKNNLKNIYDAISFILGNQPATSIKEISSFYEAKHDIKAGKHLPEVVLQGIRSTYHKNIDKSFVLEITKQNLTEKQKMQVQTRAKEAGIKVDFDATKQNVVELYIHAYAQNGITDEIKQALNIKAIKAANNSPINYRKIGIVIDASGSSFGHSTQKLRPIAITQSIRDMLIACASDEVHIAYAGGEERNGLIYPTGETNLSKPLIEVLKINPEVIFIISDGYENSGVRVHEIIEGINKLKLDISIYHINPVTSAESSGVRKLSDKLAPIPVSNPDALGTGMIKAMIQTSVKEGVLAILNTTVPKIIKSN